MYPLVRSEELWNKVIGPYTLSLEELIERAPVLVNGDDILFQAVDQAHYDTWLHAVREAGFILSVGKNYVSTKFMLVNSRYLLPDESPIPYINMGLIFGRQKGEGDSREVARTQREKMAKLPNYFTDLFEDFKFGKNYETEIADRMINIIRSSRRDLAWSGWSNFTVGLKPLLGGMSELRAFELYDDARRLRANPKSEQHYRSPMEMAAFWHPPNEISTECLQIKNRPYTPKSYLSRWFRDNVLVELKEKFVESYRENPITGAKSCYFNDDDRIQFIIDSMCSQYRNCPLLDRTGGRISSLTIGAQAPRSF